MSRRKRPTVTHARPKEPPLPEISGGFSAAEIRAAAHKVNDAIGLSPDVIIFDFLNGYGVRPMTEAEWLTSDNPASMLEWVTAQPTDRAGSRTNYVASERKLRLFAVACCKAVGLQVNDAEAKSDLPAIVRSRGVGTAAEWASNWAKPQSPHRRDTIEGVWKSEKAAFLREIIGNPWRLQRVCMCGATGAPLEPENWCCAYTGHPTAWLTPLVIGLTTTIYDERAFDRMPILGDALEDAGCTDTAILDHLRGPGPHVRGCWALDLILGKS